MPATGKEQLRARLQAVALVRRSAVEFFQDEGFLELNPVMLGMSTDPLGPDPGSSVVKTAEIPYQGQDLYLMNSMILHKQVAITRLGTPIFIMSPNVRLERPERQASGRHLFEFTQVDFEIPKGKTQDVKDVMHGYFGHLQKATDEHPELFTLLGIEPPKFNTPFPAHKTHDLEQTYAAQWSETELMASRASPQPFWAECHKREFYDKEDTEHPGHYLNYDLIYDGGFGEGLSGAERESEPSRIKQRVSKDALKKKAFAAYLRLAEEGFTPSAGAGFGVERLARRITQAPHVRDVQLFPRVPGETVEI